MKNKVRVKCDGEQLEIDIRADGGFVVAPGSVHESGFTYLREGAGLAVVMNAIEQQIAAVLPDIFADRPRRPARSIRSTR